MVHRQIRRFLLLVHAGVGRRGRGGGCLAVHWARRVGGANQTLRSSPDASRASSSHDVGLCDDCRFGAGGLSGAGGEPPGADLVVRDEHPGQLGCQQTPISRNRGDLDGRSGRRSGRRRPRQPPGQRAACFRQRRLVGSEDRGHDLGHVAGDSIVAWSSQCAPDLVRAVLGHRRSAAHHRADCRIPMLSGGFPSGRTSQRSASRLFRWHPHPSS